SLSGSASASVFLGAFALAMSSRLADEYARFGDERRVLGPGGTWRIRSDVPHEAVAGPEGAVVIDVFAPIRSDWDALPVLAAVAPAWPRGGGDQVPTDS
ncbi:MAG: hypothetical protein ACRDGB_12870, partial [Candidatus Limnocylindria bacterium]